MKIQLISDLTDLFYLTGMSLSRGLLILAESESRLYVDTRYFEEAKKKSAHPAYLWERNAPFEWAQTLSPKMVQFDSSTTSFDTYLFYQKFFPNLEPIPGLCRAKRRIKTTSEISALQKAAHLTHRGIEHVIKKLRKGVTEQELAWEFEKFVRENGASHLSFDSIIAFGEASAVPHHRACKAALHDNSIVLIDVGAVVDSYHGDLTRVAFFGVPNSVLEKRYRLIQEASQRALNAIRPGARVKDLDLVVREFFRQHGVESLFTHSLGHGIGLETHESPSIRANHADGDLLLEDGMTFTIEPGLYEPGLGGVRFEEMVVVRNGKGEVIK